MDIAPLKEVLGDEKFSELETFIDTITAKRDKALNEQITTRRGLKETVTQLELQNRTMMDKLGISSVEDLEGLPEIKGVAEKHKQDAAVIKRLERDLESAKGDAATLTGENRTLRKSGTLKDALAGHEFVSGKVGAIIEQALVWEGEELLYKQDDGSLISVKDGVAAFAKSNPEFVKPAGGKGAGFRSSNAGSNGAELTMTRAEFEALPPAKQMEIAKSGVTLQ